MNKDTELINLIKNRIDAEYRKHKTLDWSLIAAIKIVKSLKERNKPNTNPLVDVIGSYV
jgi:hypothetical protein